MTDDALIERLRAEADGMANLSQSAWGIAEPVMLGDKLEFDMSLHGFFMAVYEYCGETANIHRQAADRIAALTAERDGLREALRKLSFAAQTSGGTAGRDDALVAAIDLATNALGAQP